MSDNIEAVARDVGGRVQEAVGTAVGDAKMRVSGRYNQVAGQAEVQAAKLGDVIKEQPLTSALVALGIGYLLGRFIA